MDTADNQDRKDDGGAAGGEPKPAGEHLSLKVKSQEGNEVYFKVKKTTTFAKVMAAYCKKVGADMEQVRFLFDGARLKPEQTPADVSTYIHAHTLHVHCALRGEVISVRRGGGQAEEGRGERRQPNLSGQVAWGAVYATRTAKPILISALCSSSCVCADSWTWRMRMRSMQWSAH